jgi:hypothetical protein
MDHVGNERPNEAGDTTLRRPPQPQPQTRRVVVVLNPAGDAEFRAAVDAAQMAGVASPSDLEARLRPVVPRIVVRRRELDGEPVEVWYVYRDGHWIPAAEGGR